MRYSDDDHPPLAEIFRRWLSQQPWVLIFGVLTVGIGVGIGTVLLSWQLNAPINHLMRDGVAVLGGGWWIGAVSQLGLIVWSIAAGVCLLTAFVLRARPSPPVGRDQPGFGLFLSVGLLSLLLALDDGLMIHDDMLPPLGIDEKATVGFHALFLAAILLRYARVFLAHNGLLLAMGLAAFASSVLIDLELLFVISWDRHILLENSAKFLGLLAWTTYFTLLATQTLTSPPASAPAAAAAKSPALNIKN